MGLQTCRPALSLLPAPAAVPQPAFSSPGCWAGPSSGLGLATQFSPGRREPRGTRPLIFCARLWKLVAGVP